MHRKETKHTVIFVAGSSEVQLQYCIKQLNVNIIAVHMHNVRRYKSFLIFKPSNSIICKMYKINYVDPA